jgi:hypothetical protein
VKRELETGVPLIYRLNDEGSVVSREVLAPESSCSPGQ